LEHTETKTEELRCPRCKRNDIVPSKPRGILDDIMFGLGRVPRHCRSCEKRFYIPAPPGEGPRADEDSETKKEEAGA
jgi:hypothetical protein